MNMQIYHQFAAINTKVKMVRNLLAEVETQQTTLKQLLHFRQSNRQLYPRTMPVLQEMSGDVYVRNLVRTGRLSG